MLTIRLNRVGRRNRPSFRVVVQEHTVAPGGRHVEVLGSYDPFSKKSTLKSERVKHWMSNGAQVSDTVFNLLVREGIVSGGKRAVKISRPAKDDATEASEPSVQSVPETVGSAQ